jgi:hypothetical protein
MSTQHVEFPELTPEADAAMRAGAGPTADIIASFGYRERRSYAAFLREAMNQAKDNNCILLDVGKLRAIAANLHSPPPPPPTLAQAWEADLDTPEGKAVLRAFLATLGEAGQP